MVTGVRLLVSTANLLPLPSGSSSMVFGKRGRERGRELLDGGRGAGVHAW